MPDPTTPNYSHHNPAHRDSVISLADAVCRLWPGARVNTSHSGPIAAWVQSVHLPFGEKREVVITLEIDGWQAESRLKMPRGDDYAAWPLSHANSNDLIAVIHDAFAYIHDRTHALGA